ncbi:MAG: hypothetical protein AB2L09_09075 [Coriobacteriia bacterium]
MKAVHLKAIGVHDRDEATLVEMSVRFAEGVADVATIRALGLVSVLYDERRTDSHTILRTIRSLGFDAHLCEPRELARAS